MKYGSEACCQNEPLGSAGAELESDLLLRAGALLHACQLRWHDQSHSERLDEALRYNERLWSAFASAMQDSSAPHTPAIKTHIKALAAFIQQRINDVRDDPCPDKLTVIIQIDRQIAAGLWDSQQHGEILRAAVR